jgi:fructose-bisphosphate aldolase class I
MSAAAKRQKTEDLDFKGFGMETGKYAAGKSAGFAFREELEKTAKAMVADGKGLLAADESTGTIGKRFAGIGVENTEDNRRAYRELLFTTKGFEQYVSGVIMFEETLGQSCVDGTPFVELLKRKGVIPGIKVDKGVQPLAGTDGDTYTTGLDGLGARCKGYYERGARFAKWRAVLKMGANGELPSELSIRENAYGLARYAATCQENGLVPIVEPELLMDGSHGIEVCQVATEKILAATYKALSDCNVFLEGSILKPNMVCPGASHKGEPANPSAVAIGTVKALLRGLPAAVPGVVFLSGGQSEEEASINLSAINAVAMPRPWSLTFSYGRALQASCLKAWVGKAANVPKAQVAFLERAKANSLGAKGQYVGSGEAGAASEKLFVAGYSY